MVATSLLIIFNLFILESLLSIDNAAVLAIMVKGLPKDQQSKALRYGILGAFVFRGLCLFLAAWLIKILWLKIIGGIYLLYLVYDHFNPKEDVENRIAVVPESDKSPMRLFWSTVLMVEIMDIAFSIDNVFAAVAMTNNIYLILIGVCLGIVTMRFVAIWFTKLMEKHPTLENSAFVVIALLGLKLIVAGILDTFSCTCWSKILSSHWFDLGFSATMILIFAVPVLDNYINKEYEKEA